MQHFVVYLILHFLLCLNVINILLYYCTQYRLYQRITHLIRLVILLEQLQQLEPLPVEDQQLLVLVLVVIQLYSVFIITQELLLAKLEPQLEQPELLLAMQEVPCQHPLSTRQLLIQLTLQLHQHFKQQSMLPNFLPILKQLHLKQLILKQRLYLLLIQWLYQLINDFNF